MPACDATFNHAKSGLIQAPPGTSVKMHPGTFVLQVHYDNTYHVPIENDKSGIRFWVLPKEQAALTESGNIVNHVGQLSSIRIPADPLQREYPLQFMISSEATKATLPETGIQVFGVSLHMHKAGLRGRLQLIRNGENILDVYDYRSYDFDLQAPNLKRWRMLPGDAMVVTCIFKPNKYTDIVGGLRTEDEMCNWAIGFSPELPNYRSGVGYLVSPDEPFKNSFIGNVPNSTRGLYMPEEMAPFKPDPRGWVDLRDYREDFCYKSVRDESNLFEFHWGDAGVYALYTAMITFFCCFCLERFLPAIKMMGDTRTKRNAVVGIIQLVFSTAFLIPLLVLAAPIFNSNLTFKAYDVETYNELRGLIATQILLYIFELFYRVNIRIEVIIHHMLTTGLFIFLNYVAAYSFAFEYATKMGAILILLAMLDQPKNAALVTKYLGYEKARWWPNFCKISAIWYIASKLVIISIAIFFMAEAEDGSDASWNVPEHSFSKWIMDYGLNGPVVIGVVVTFLFLLLLDQVYTAYVLWKIALRAEVDTSFEEEEPLAKSSDQDEVLSMKKEMDGELSPLNKATTTHNVSDESSGNEETISASSNASVDDAVV